MLRLTGLGRWVHGCEHMHVPAKYVQESQSKVAQAGQPCVAYLVLCDVRICGNLLHVLACARAHILPRAQERMTLTEISTNVLKGEGGVASLHQLGRTTCRCHTSP